MVEETPGLPESTSEIEVIIDCIEIELKNDQEETSTILDPVDQTIDQEKTALIADAVAQTGVEVIAQSPAMSEGSLYQTNSQLTSQSVQNSVNYQKQLTLTQQTATANNLAIILPSKSKQAKSNTLKTLKQILTLVQNLQ